MPVYKSHLLPAAVAEVVESSEEVMSYQLATLAAEAAYVILALTEHYKIYYYFNAVKVYSHYPCEKELLLEWAKGLLNLFICGTGNMTGCSS